jgi:hypothetical protein
MSIPGFGGGGGSPVGGVRPSMTRGRMGGSYAGGMSYPSPFFDVAQTWLPRTIKEMFKYCRYYFLTNPLINATVFKLSEYAVTDLVVEHQDPEVVKLWTEFLQEVLRIRSFQIETGLDYNTFGNALVGVSCPFDKYLRCKSCGFQSKASSLRTHWKTTNHAFRLTCPKCTVTGDAVVRDVYLKKASGIKLIRWNPEDVEITYNDITGNYTHYYNIPNRIKNDITIGRKEVIEQIPQLFIDSLKEQKGLVFSPDSLFHLRRPTLAGEDRGWGVPLLMPVLKDTHYLQIMKKAQESILLEHIVPLRILFPQAASGSADPYTSVNLGDWRDHVAKEIMQWRMDNNYIPILPLPIGNQTIGGDGRALLLSSEIQSWSEQIMVGLGVPREFLMGGMSYAGTNVSMRMLENQFLRYIQRQLQLVHFVIRQVAYFMDWPMVKVRFKPFKMADDIQRKAYLLQLNQAQKISDRTLLADADLDIGEENAAMIEEVEGRMEAVRRNQVAMAAIQGEASVVMSKYQVKAQQAQAAAQASPPAQGEPGGPETQQPGGAPGGEVAEAGQIPGGAEAQPTFDQQTQSPLNAGQNMQAQGNLNVDLRGIAMQHAQMLAPLPPEMQQQGLQNLRAQSPALAGLVEQLLSTLGDGGSDVGAPPSKGGLGAAGAATQTINMKPLPDKLPPRRAAGII